MFKVLPRNILRFAFLVALQVLVLNNIQFSGYVNPFLYILFIILLPFETPNWSLLMIAFGLGLSVDVFSDTMGMHAASTVFVAFLRPFVLKYISPRDGYEVGTFPRLYYYGFEWFFKYAAVMVLAHHLFYFIVEAFTFSNFLITLWKVTLSSFFTLILIMLSQFFMYRK